MNAEAPIDVSAADNAWNEPETRPHRVEREFTAFDSNPQPEDLALLVEVADSTLRYDLTVKAAIYARAGIAEYWVLDVSGRRLIAHRNPGSGVYGSVEVYSETEVIALLAAPRADFRPGDAFGRPERG